MSFKEAMVYKTLVGILKIENTVGQRVHTPLIPALGGAKARGSLNQRAAWSTVPG